MLIYSPSSETQAALIKILVHFVQFQVNFLAENFADAAGTPHVGVFYLELTTVENSKFFVCYITRVQKGYSLASRLAETA